MILVTGSAPYREEAEASGLLVQSPRSEPPAERLALVI
jgi:hypothetical protein